MASNQSTPCFLKLAESDWLFFFQYCESCFSESMQCKFSFVAEIINHAAYLRFLVKRTKLIFHGLLVLWSTCWCINSFHLFFTSLWWVEHLQNWMTEKGKPMRSTMTDTQGKYSLWKYVVDRKHDAHYNQWERHFVNTFKLSLLFHSCKMFVLLLMATVYLIWS